MQRLLTDVPQPWRSAIDWILTIVGAIAVVLAIKAWVINPYRIPTPSMEPTLHCARPAQGCEAESSDRVLANRFIYHFHDPKRGEIVVFNRRSLIGQVAAIYWPLNRISRGLWYVALSLVALVVTTSLLVSLLRARRTRDNFVG